MPEPVTDPDELRESFSYNDVDGDGRIGFGEFLRMLDQLEAGTSEAEARIGFETIDGDQDGSISFDEFAGWWTAR